MGYFDSPQAFDYSAIKDKFGKGTANELLKLQSSIASTNPLQTDSSSNQPFRQLYQNAFVDTQKEGLQGWAKSAGNKELYSMLGGKVDEADPWGFYRESFGNQLAQQQKVDPSDIYRDKLAAMAGGNFDINDPSYKWRFKQGQQALERSQASRGLLGSGNAAIELQDYGQGAASQEYGAHFNRMLQGLSGVQQQYSSQQSRLMELAGVGLDPLGSRKVGVGEMGNAVSAQGNQLQAQSQANQLGFEQTKWQDQINMNADYQQGLKAGMTPTPTLSQQLGGGGESPSYWR